MGNACGKKELKDAEIYGQQPKIQYDQLNTENDLNGQITNAQFIVKKPREVLGQQPTDMAANPVDWSEYGLDLKDIGRPVPEDFPAFEIRDAGGQRASVEVTRYSSAEKNRSRNSKQESNSKNIQKEQTPDPASKSILTPTKQNSKTSKSGDQSKEKSKDKADKKRVSANAEMDQCSLED